MLEVGVDRFGEHRSEVAVQGALDDRPQLIRADHDEMLKRPAPMRAQQALGDPARVSRYLLLDPALKARLGPAALGVSAVNLILDRRELAQTMLAAPEQPRGAPAHHSDAQSPGEIIAASGSSQGTASTTVIGSTTLGRRTASRMSAPTEEKIARPLAPRVIAGSPLNHARIRSTSCLPASRRA